MSLTAESIAPDTHSASAAVSVEVSERDLLRLQDLANRVSASGADVAELARAAFHRGVIETDRRTGLDAMPCSCDRCATASREAASDRAREHAAPGGRHLSRRAVALCAAALATFVLILGSYAARWSWTGLTQNGQVWDWMQLLLLPVALGTLPLWLRFSGEMSPARRRALAGGLMLFGAFVLMGYLVPLHWTGFRGHTLWNWLTLIVLPVTVTTATVWPKTGRTVGPIGRGVAALLGAAWVVSVVGGYALGWAWTGYEGNTLWEWVQLLLAPVAISTFVVPELVKLTAGTAARAREALVDADGWPEPTRRCRSALTSLLGREPVSR